MYKFIKIIGFLIISIILLSCSKSSGYKKQLNIPYKNLEPQEVQIIEYNKAFFGIDTADFEEGIRALQPQFKDLLGENPDKMQIKYLKDFATDTIVLYINRLVEELYPDANVFADDVKDVYQHLNYYYPDIKLPQTYSYVSGVSYESDPVMINRNAVLIGLDYYLENNDLIYDKLGIPRYISRRYQPASLSKDVAESLYFAYVYKRYNAKNALTDMVERGKRLFFIEAMAPNLPDSIILGYSASQMQWAYDNEGQVWASVVGNNMLYVNNYDTQRVLFSDGPFTAPFGEDAPARLGEFIGLQIVRSFMSNNDVTLTELMNMTNQQDIFQRSQYKPRK